MIVQGNYYCNLCSSSKDLIGLYWMPTGLDERAAQSVENHICKDCLLSLEPIAANHRTLDKVEEFIEATTIAPPELEPQVCDHYRQRALKAVEDWDGQDTDDLFDAICEAMGDQPKKWTRDPKPEPELRLPEGWTKPKRRPMSSNLLSDLRARANELQAADMLYREAFPGYEPEPEDSLIPLATLLHDAANALELAEAEVERLRNRLSVLERMQKRGEMERSSEGQWRRVR